MKAINFNLVLESKGRPPVWLPAFMKPWFTWTTRKAFIETVPVGSQPDYTETIDLPFGAVLQMDMTDGYLSVSASYAGLHMPLVNYHYELSKPLSVSGSAGGFKLYGTVALVDA